MSNKKNFIQELYDHRILYLMTLPGILFFLAFKYVPMFGIVMAFKNYNLMDGIWGSPWTGLKNFEFFLTSGAAFRITFNTLFLNALIIATGTVMQITTAILLNEISNKWVKKGFQSIIFFPYFLSWIVIATLIYSLFSSERGSINNILSSIGVQPVYWYGNAKYWRSILVAANLWKWTGYGSVIYLAAIAGIDPTYYEAAVMDGASKAQRIFRITIPFLLPTMMTLILLAVGRIFYGNFGMIYAIIKDNGLLLRTTEVIDTYVYRAMRTTGNFSLSTSIGLLQSLAGFVTVFTCNYLAKKLNPDWALF